MPITVLRTESKLLSLFGPQSLRWIGGGCALSWGESSSCGCCDQGQGGDGEDGEAHALGFVELRFDIADAKPGYGYSDGCEADRGLEHGAAHDHTHNGAAVCAQGHADTDLAGAASYRVGSHTIEAEGCEHESQDAEERHEARDH